MLFTSWEFLLFIGILFLIYYLIPKRGQWILLLCASLLFYYFAAPIGLVYMAVTVFATWLIALRIDKLRAESAAYFKTELAKASPQEKKAFKEKSKKRFNKYLVLCIVIDLGLLFVLKYANFVLTGVNALFFRASEGLTFANLAAPMGISFYTLSALGYVIDITHGKYRAERNPAKFALYVSFFPTVVQGPISRFEEVSKTLYAPHAYDAQNVMRGLMRIAWGYFKKLVIADRMLVAVSVLSGDPEAYMGAWSLCLLVFYTVQIYADFTGGIDITIGIAQVFGVKLQENFDRPFFSKSIAEYWRRWHISMGSWFRDYVFYPISASKGLLKLAKNSRKKLGDGFGRRLSVYVSTIVVWFITGLWHGASMNFIVWGLLNGVIIMIATELAPLFDRFHNKYPDLLKKDLYKGMQAARTVAITACLRMLDLNTSVAVTFRRFGSIFTTANYHIFTDGSILSLGLSGADYIIILVGILVMFAVSLLACRKTVMDRLEKRGYAAVYACFALLIVLTLVFGAYGIGYDSSQFIYNQF